MSEVGQETLLGHTQDVCTCKLGMGKIKMGTFDRNVYFEDLYMYNTCTVNYIYINSYLLSVVWHQFFIYLYNSNIFQTRISEQMLNVWWGCGREYQAIVYNRTFDVS